VVGLSVEGVADFLKVVEDGPGASNGGPRFGNLKSLVFKNLWRQLGISPL